jgi:hypothetical protein
MLCPECIFVVTKYFALSNGPNWEVIWIIPIFWVIYCQNVVIWPPGWPYKRLPATVLQLNFEEIPSCFVLNVFLWLLCIIKCSKLGSYLNNTNIWGHFWSKFGYLTHCSALGWPYIWVAPIVLQLILNKYHHDLPWMYFCGYCALSNGPNWEVIGIIPIFG